MSKRVLLTVSGRIPPDVDVQVASGRRPRPDYLMLADALGADLLDFEAARRHVGWFGRIIERLAGPKALLAWATFRVRRAYSAVVTDGEQIGIPYAALGKASSAHFPHHSMICHVLSVPKKELPWKLLRLGTRVDKLFVYASAQGRFAIDELRVAPERVVLTPFMVDTQFFSPANVARPVRRMICSVGLERRDFHTLCAAVEGLDVEVVIAVGSHWSTQPDRITGRPLPANVRVCTLDFVALRELYAECLFVVMPLVETDFQAGVTSILEAMAMGKPVVCSSTTGQTDVIVEGRTGLYAPPGDPGALRAAIVRLLDDPEYAVELGRAARVDAEERFDVAQYAKRLAGEVLSP
jgi:glycosyltransferase involved in cell wall biosynthesis